MCYAKKIVGYKGKDLGPKYNGQFECARFNCNGCNEGFVVGEAPKRNQDLKLKILKLNWKKSDF